MKSQSPIIRLGEIPKAGLARTWVATEADRKATARDLGLAALNNLEADLDVSLWQDGVEIDGRWRADLVQTCSVTLEPLPAMLSGDFRVRVVPPESAFAPTAEALADLDPEAEDPPDVSESGEVDLAAYVLEHLALDIDPFPRAPGAVFQPPEESAELSPFAVLKKLKKD